MSTTAEDDEKVSGSRSLCFVSIEKHDKAKEDGIKEEEEYAEGDHQGALQKGEVLEAVESESFIPGGGGVFGVDGDVVGSWAELWF